MPANDRPSLRIDRALVVAEWLVAALLLAYAGFRIVDGPVRDRLYLRSIQPAADVTQPVQAKVPAARPTATAVIGVNDDVAMRYPELGRSLPSIRPRTVPQVSPDYLVPARRFVAAPPVAPPAPATGESAAAPDLQPAHVSAPRVKLNAPIKEVFLEDGVWQVADYAAGYLHGTGTPAEGNLVLAGHKGVRGAVFSRLERLKFGDEIFIDAGSRRFRYRVRETGRVWPSQVRIIYPTATPTLTLLTCTNWDMQRFVVIADLVDSVELAAASG